MICRPRRSPCEYKNVRRVYDLQAQALTVRIQERAKGFW